jgi:hypothetical protein
MEVLYVSTSYTYKKKQVNAFADEVCVAAQESSKGSPYKKEQTMFMRNHIL